MEDLVSDLEMLDGVIKDLRQKTKKAAYDRAYRIKMRERRRAYNHQYYLDHLEQQKAKNKRNSIKRSAMYAKRAAYYYRKNKLKHNEWCKDNYRKNREAYKARIKKYHLENPHVKVISAERRRAGKVSEAEDRRVSDYIKCIKKKPWVRCFYCGLKMPGKKAHIDHITPISKGGKHVVENLCPSCQPCNGSKTNHHLPDWKRSGQLFLV